MILRYIEYRTSTTQHWHGPALCSVRGIEPALPSTGMVRHCAQSENQHYPALAWSGTVLSQRYRTSTTQHWHGPALCSVREPALPSTGMVRHCAQSEVSNQHYPALAWSGTVLSQRTSTTQHWHGPALCSVREPALPSTGMVRHCSQSENQHYPALAWSGTVLSQRYRTSTTQHWHGPALCSVREPALPSTGMVRHCAQSENQHYPALAWSGTVLSQRYRTSTTQHWHGPALCSVRGIEPALPSTGMVRHCAQSEVSNQHYPALAWSGTVLSQNQHYPALAWSGTVLSQRSS